MKKTRLNIFPQGSLIRYLDQEHQRFFEKLVTKRSFFQKQSNKTLELSLQKQKQHMEWHSTHELALPKPGSGYDELHWPTVFFSSVHNFFGSKPNNNGNSGQ